MMRLSLLFILLLSFVPAEAKTDRARSHAIYGGLGIGREMSSLELESNSADFLGWNLQLFGGIEKAFGNAWGVYAEASLAQSEFNNTKKSTLEFERGESTSTGARAGVWFGNFGVGYGVSNDVIDVKQVSSTTGYSESKISGPVSEIVINYVLVNDDTFRFSAEIQNRTGTLDSYGFEQWRLLGRLAVSLF